jgi:Zn-dependent protease with chaperone function
MWRAFANLEYQSADMTWLAWHPWLVNLITHASIAWELSFCVLIWLRLWRPPVLAGAVVLHLGIGLFLGMWTFGLVMLIGCASFLPAEAVRQFVAAWVPARVGRTPNTEASVVDRVGREGADAPVGVAVQR